MPHHRNATSRHDFTPNLPHQPGAAFKTGVNFEDFNYHGERLKIIRFIVFLFSKWLKYRRVKALLGYSKGLSHFVFIGSSHLNILLKFNDILILKV
jgi:hypothetical protein